MSERTLGLYLLHIADSLRMILEYTKDVDFDRFVASRLIQDAVVRNFEIVGEAAKSIPEEYRLAHPGVDWKSLAGLRDILIHQYFGINLDTVWAIVEREVHPSLNIIESLPEYQSAAKVLG